MAFSFKTEGDNKNLMNIVGVVVVIMLLGLGTYLLFFAPEPFVEVVAPTELESVSELSSVSLNDSALKDDPVYNLLENKVEGVEPGEAGRDNPFARF
ncbi:hypothetical protein KKH05_03140 [Patescibacteria group bacterium]|nr:hypothetical protein [Patescibacteria group bacterium]